MLVVTPQHTGRPTRRLRPVSLLRAKSRDPVDHPQGGDTGGRRVSPSALNPLYSFEPAGVWWLDLEGMGRKKLGDFKHGDFKTLCLLFVYCVWKSGQPVEVSSLHIFFFLFN